ncbi:MAG: DUF2254 domain-containing protein [Chloroflexia bacterium]|nr:DUF2254 domain-containing protein [Chloroflexia bacterium]
MAEKGKAIRRAFREFLTIPIAVIAAFLLLAVGSYVVERADEGWIQDLRRLIQSVAFESPEATSGLLGEIAGGLITVTSITFSLLLLAVSQTASSYTGVVFDQFLRWMLNQLFFGYFIGLALYALVVLATVRPEFNPVFGASLALALMVVALLLLILLIYDTIDQMRPDVIVDRIHDHTLVSRRRELAVVRRTRRQPHRVDIAGSTVKAREDGFVTDVDLDTLVTALREVGGEAEVELRVVLGSYVAFGDPLAEVRAPGTGGAALAEAVHRAIELDRIRALERDPAYGIEQLTSIGWTSISTARQNQAAGRLAILALRDLLGRWSRPDAEGEGAVQPAAVVAVVYRDDVPAGIVGALESLAVVATESMQHQSFAEVLRAFAATFGDLAPDDRRRVEDAIARLLSGMGDLVLTADLVAALAALTEALDRARSVETLAAVRRAEERLARSLGELNSRATRVPAGAS